MTKAHSTKKALLMSVLSLVLCFAMLAGTTYAWFTDSVTSAGNKIQAGTLKIDLRHEMDGTWVSLKEEEDHKIFDYDLWEPGYIRVETLKVINLGSLALQYRLSIERDASTAILGLNGEDLADVIDVYITAGNVDTTDRTTVTGWTYKGTLTEVMANPATFTGGKLLPASDASDDENDYTIALVMRESAGNEYQGLSVGSIFVNLVATQVDYEKDSFDDSYDAGLPFPDADGDMMVIRDDVQYLYRADSTHWLYSANDYTGDTLNVAPGVTTIGGSSLAYNTSVKTVVFPSSVTTVRTNMMKGNTTVEKVVLNEGLVDLSTYERPFNQALGLKEVVFPSTLKKIGKQAFALTAMEDVTLPANVEFLGEGAFRDMPNLKTVTIEGNAEIGNFAFRSCPSLETVYLLGDDVTFAGTSQAFSHADTGDATGITIFVANETVAERVRAAQGSATGYTVRIIGQPLNVTVTSEAELLDALANITEPTVIDATGVALSLAEKQTNLSGGVTLKGATIIVPAHSGGQYLMCTGGVGEEIVFEDCTFQRHELGALFIGAADANGSDIVFNNCVFEGPVAPNFTAKADGVAEFNGCTFKTGYAFMKQGWVNCMGGTSIFTDCTFDYTGGSTSGSNQYTRWNAVNSFSERYSTAVELVGCTFINCGTQRYGSNSTLTIK